MSMTRAEARRGVIDGLRGRLGPSPAVSPGERSSAQFGVTVLHP